MESVRHGLRLRHGHSVPYGVSHLPLHHSLLAWLLHHCYGQWADSCLVALGLVTNSRLEFLVFIFPRNFFMVCTNYNCLRCVDKAAKSITKRNQSSAKTIQISQKSVELNWIEDPSSARED